MPVLLVCEQRACTNILARAERSLYRVHHGQAIDIMAWPLPRHPPDHKYEADSRQVAELWLQRVSQNLDNAYCCPGHTMYFKYEHYLPNNTRRAPTMLALSCTPGRPLANYLADVSHPAETVTELVHNSPNASWTGWHGSWSLNDQSWQNRFLNVVFRFDGGRNLEPINHQFVPQSTNGRGLLALKATKWEGGQEHWIYLSWPVYTVVSISPQLALSDGSRADSSVSEAEAIMTRDADPELDPDTSDFTFV